MPLVPFDVALLDRCCFLALDAVPPVLLDKVVLLVERWTFLELCLWLVTLLDDLDRFLVTLLFPPLASLTRDGFVDARDSMLLSLTEVSDATQAKHTPFALEIFTDPSYFVLPLQLLDDKLHGRRALLTLALCSADLVESVLAALRFLPLTLLLKDRLLTVRCFLAFSFGRLFLSLAEELLDRRALLAVRLCPLAMLDDTLLDFRFLLTPRFFLTLLLRDLLVDLRRFFVWTFERLLSLLDEVLLDRRTL